VRLQSWWNRGSVVGTGSAFHGAIPIGRVEWRGVSRDSLRSSARQILQAVRLLLPYCPEDAKRNLGGKQTLTRKTNGVTFVSLEAYSLPVSSSSPECSFALLPACFLGRSSIHSSWPFTEESDKRLRHLAQRHRHMLRNPGIDHTCAGTASHSNALSNKCYFAGLVGNIAVVSPTLQTRSRTAPRKPHEMTATGVTC
jgi:hypothetical protein